MTPYQAAQSFYSYLEDHCSENTLRSYQVDISNFLEYLEGAGLLRSFPDQLTPAHIYEFLSNLRHSGYKPTSVTRKFSALRSFFKFLCRKNRTLKNATASVSAPPSKPVPIETLSHKEISDLLEAANHHMRDYLIIHLLCWYGPKLNEVAALDKKDIQEDEIVFGKRSVPTWSKSKALIARYKAKYPGVGPCFVNKFGTRLSARSINRVIEKYTKQTEVHVTPSILRHTFTMHSLEQRWSLNRLSRYLGLGVATLSSRYITKS